MRKKVLFLLLICILGIKAVKAYSTDSFVNVVNNGDVTKAFEKQMKKDGCEVSLTAFTEVQSTSISYSVVCEEEKEEEINGRKEIVKNKTYDVQGSIYFVLKENILESTVERTEDDMKADPFYEKILRLTPYWGAEMSSKYKDIKEYVKKNHENKILDVMPLIFDRCYMEEMGVCYSMTPGMNYNTFIGKVTMDDTGGTYALKYLQREEREIKNKSLVFKGVMVAIVLVILLVLAKGLSNKAKPKVLKY